MDQQPFVQSQPQAQPQQVVYMPIPAVQTVPTQDSIKEAELKVEQAQKRVKCTSKVLLVLGALGVVCSLVHGMGARNMAERIIHGRKAWGPPPTKEEHMAMGTQVITRDELELYDTMKNMSYLMFLMSILVAGMAKCGMRSVWMQKSQVGKRMIKKSAIVFAIIALFGMGLMHQGKHMHKIAKEYRKESPEDQYDEYRRSEDRFPEFLSVNDACTYSDADSCDAASTCTWCKSAAVASSCKDINDAKSLPASIFQCDKIQEVEEVTEPVKNTQAFDLFMQPSAACSHSDADSCDADDACTWCKSAAVASSCKDINDAKSLPASIFQCDKIQEEVKAVKTRELFDQYTLSSAACSHSDADSCDADNACTWCKSAAVASSCKDINDAKSLPASIFQCDKIQEEVESVKTTQELLPWMVNYKNDACTYSDADSCDAASTCTWCASAAVKSRCYDVADAKALPSSIFACDKLQEEEPHHNKHHGHHGKHHGHHGKAHRAVGPLILIIAVAAHFYNMRTYVQVMEVKETLKGETKDIEGGCPWRKNKKENKKVEQVQQVSVPVSYAPVSSPVVMMPATQMQ